MKYTFISKNISRSTQLIALLLCTLSGLQVNGQFEWRTVSPLPTGNTINGVAFPTSSSTVAVGNAGTVIASEDGGFNWLTLNSSSEFSNLTVVDVDFANANTGYILLRRGRWRYENNDWW